MLKFFSIFVMLTTTLSAHSQYCQNDLTQEEKDSARKHWKKTLWALKAADEFNYKSMH